MNLEAWLVLLEQRHPREIDLGLERCGNVYQRLGSPRPAKKVYTIAGTNGKGSTVAYLAAMSAAIGQRHGTYTSPHIFRFNERINILGEPVTDACLVNAFEQVELARGDISLTYFEFTTLAALLIMRNSDLDCAILEVGLGGRLDTVNLVDADCVVITPIGLDHQEYLGADLPSIAAEKAGVIRSGIPVVCTEANPPGPVVQIAARLGASIYRRGSEFDLVHSQVLDNEGLHFSLDGRSMPVPKPPMGGRHQQDNLAAALAALFLLNPGSICKDHEISKAIDGCRVPGRLQRVHTSPEILLDVGHNELAATVVADYLESTNRSEVSCVLSMLADKSTETVALALGKVCRRWLCAGSTGTRGQSGKVLARRVKSVLPGADVKSFEWLDEAMREAVTVGNRDETILVFGSFSTVSGAADWINGSMQRDRHDAAKITRPENATDP